MLICMTYLSTCISARQLYNYRGNTCKCKSTIPPIQPPARILVTGVNGFMGSHIAHTLLSRGYRVRATVRAISKGDFLANRFESEFGKGKFEVVVVPDLLSQNAFEKALESVSGAVHIATPVVVEHADPALQLSTAKLGTLGLLKAAAKMEQIGSVIVTGSFAAVIFSGKGPGEDMDEADWNTVSENYHTQEDTAEELKGLHAYLASKTAAEKVAWDFVER